MPSENAEKPSKYLYEVDLLRVLFIFSVIATHVTTKINEAIPNDTFASQYLFATHMTLHFSRLGFMFVSGLVIFLNYYAKKLEIWRFWRKRFFGIIWAYLLWILIYTIIQAAIQNATAAEFWQTLTKNWLYGDDFYMYYVIVTLQFYLVFPALRSLFKRFKHERLVAVSLAVQLITLTVIKYVIPNVDTSRWLWWFREYGYNFLTYQFYFVLGSYFAIHYHQVMPKLMLYRRQLTVAVGVLGALTIAVFGINRSILDRTIDQAQNVHQPFVLFYAVVVIAWAMTIGMRYAQARETNALPKWVVSAVTFGSKISFGMYLSQTVILTTLSVLLSRISVDSGLLLATVPVSLLVVFGLTYLLSGVLYRTPKLSVLAGKSPWRS
ncbi:acyltransferase [Weissella confusa]|uniref:acyltransferase n=1 Tax=Weissella confusa TaxID=1583 RepID=UPI000704D318|nr:acyltransferase [Weissella confusa]KRN23190.1 acyltransferase [Weissella confusa]MBJ7655814.1 acyltransferase [Weissella confusa]MBJ7698701.1 acyltransferase [Weissella confusa]MBS7550651.1 acyltransferase [Weissella confusa]MCQ8096494.1 acyltransferase [Weissella confusa]